MALVSRTVILAKVESNYGTDATPTGTDGVLAVNAVRPDPRFESVVRNAQKASLGKLPPISALGGNDPGASIAFDVEIRGAGSAYSTTVLPKVDPLLKACGLTGSVSSGTSVTYSPVSTGIPGVTIYAYMDGQLFKFVGCRGNARLTMKAGQCALWSFQFEALSANLSDASLVTGTYEVGNTVPPVWLKYGTVNALGIGTAPYAAVVQSAEVNLGNNIQIQPNANTASGRGEVIITERDIQGSMDPELVAVATYPFFADATGAVQKALAIQVGTAQFNRLIVNASRMVPASLSVQERAGKRTFSMPFKLAELNGDDEVTFVYS